MNTIRNVETIRVKIEHPTHQDLRKFLGCFVDYYHTYDHYPYHKDEIINIGIINTWGEGKEDVCIVDIKEKEYIELDEVKIVEIYLQVPYYEEDKPQPKPKPDDSINEVEDKLNELEEHFDALDPFIAQYTELEEKMVKVIQESHKEKMEQLKRTLDSMKKMWKPNKEQ